MAERLIVDYTEKVAAEIAAEYASAPRDELHVWVRLAHQREAMVTQLYDLSQIDARLNNVRKSDAAVVIRSVIASIWAHEESHTHFLSSVRSLSENLPDAAEIQGKLEGKIIRSAVSGGVLARVLIAIGSSLKRVPDFAADLRRLNLRQLVQFHGELETTARMGYRRILELVHQVSEGASRPLFFREFGLTFRYDIARILSEEQFHEEVFRAMSDWVSTDGETFLSITSAECARILHDLADRNLSVGAVRRVEPKERRLRQPDKPGYLSKWVSDGGLGKLFSDYQLPVPLVDVDAGDAPPS